MDPTAWWLFAGATALIAATPGPNMLHVMTVSVREGFARSIWAMAGCLSAVLVCVTASALGLGALLVASTAVFEALRWIGVAYLLWLGWRSWQAPVDPQDHPAAGLPRSGVRPGAATLYRMALFTGLSNPKLIVFAAAFFPQFIRADRPWAPQFGILVGTFAVIECACYVAYASGGRRLARSLSSVRRRRLFNRLTGVLFGGFALGLAIWRA